MKAISLFTGAGGLDLGCEAAGFRTVAAVELDETARRTLVANRERHLPELRPEALLEDVTVVDAGDLLDRAGLAVGDEVALVHGGPPCTPFSKSGYWLAYKRAGEDPKASLLDHYAAAVRAIRPKAFLMENVFALGYRNHNRPVLERFIADVEDAGYSFDMRAVVAADYGAPQLRQRLLCVGIREDVIDLPRAFYKFPWPASTHSGPHETRTNYDRTLRPHVTTREAFDGLSDDSNPPEPEEIVSGTFEEELHGVPPGDNYLFWTAHRGHPAPRFEWRKRYWTFLLKLHPDRPSPTIQGQPGPWVGPFHWENRRLRVAELKRLMTFPDDYAVLGSRRDQQLQLGNAVPPMLARAIARALADELRRLGALDSMPLAGVGTNERLPSAAAWPTRMPANQQLLTYLRGLADAYEFDLTAIYRRHGEHRWPLTAETAEDLERQLREGGHFLPLPKEPAALANVLEVSLIDYLLEAFDERADATAQRGTERGYPDLEIAGGAFGDRFHALDIKVARRARGERRTQSRITLYTGNTYFRYPQLRWPGTFRAFQDYASHLDLIALYTLDESSVSRVRDLELLVHQPWRIASRQRSSTTREYIGAVQSIEALRAGTGEFDNEAAFYTYWRRFPFRIGRAVQGQLDRLLKEQTRPS